MSPCGQNLFSVLYQIKLYYKEWFFSRAISMNKTELIAAQDQSDSHENNVT